MTDDELNRMREDAAHVFVNECPKYSGYPEHKVTFNAGWDARDRIAKEETGIRMSQDEFEKVVAELALLKLCVNDFREALNKIKDLSLNAGKLDLNDDDICMSDIYMCARGVMLKHSEVL